MEDWDNQVNEAVEAGQKNLKASSLLKNWCFHAEITRSPGRGMIEANTGLPIGHMGVECEFSKKNTMLTWLLEDAIYDFYVSNCKNCEKRTPVAIPNILDFVKPREEAAKLRKQQQEAAAEERNQARLDRQNERVKVRQSASLEETFVIDLLDELDIAIGATRSVSTRDIHAQNN